MNTPERGRIHPWTGYLVVFALALASRILLSFLPVNYVSEGQRSVFSWEFFGLFAILYVVAVALAKRSGLPTLESTLSGHRRRWLIPAAVGIAVACLTILSDVIAPVSKSRGVPTVHIEGVAAIPFYVYGAILLTTVFHFVPISLGMWLARRVRGGARAALLTGVVVLVALSEDAGYFLQNRSIDGVEAWRHLLSVSANGAEAIFILRFGFLAGLTQRSATYLLWHILWPAMPR